LINTWFHPIFHFQMMHIENDFGQVNGREPSTITNLMKT
jgi:hypothetical protein